VYFSTPLSGNVAISLTQVNGRPPADDGYYAVCGQSAEAFGLCINNGNGQQVTQVGNAQVEWIAIPLNP
jgi:hypothetical protein